VSTCAKKISVTISAKEILHLGKSRVYGLSLFSFFSQGREITRVRSKEEEGRTCGVVQLVQQIVPHNKHKYIKYVNINK
jgi:hypothetical protein